MNSVIKKIMYYVDVKCCSPIAISNGQDNFTDSDLLRDYDGIPFVPGSALAGAFRRYLGWMKEEKCLFGFSSSAGGNGQISSLFVSDLKFEDSSVITTIRDGVALGEGKIAISGEKYDYEVVDTGTGGRFIMELIIREADKQDENQINSQISQILKAIQEHEIRIGAKKSKGLGELSITCVRTKEYTKDNILEYKNAYNEKQIPALKDQKDSILSNELDRKYISIKVPLRLEGGISIRQYSARKNLPDYVQLTVRGDEYAGERIPVIPGTSIGGVIRHRVAELLEELKIESASLIMDTVFGYVKGKQSLISNVFFGESRIEGARALSIVRNSVSRFESAARDGSLYKELSYYNGTTDLLIQVKKGIQLKKNDTESIDITDYVIGFLLIAIIDIQNGYLPVGGQTAIGRGCLLKNGEITIDGKNNKTADYVKNCIKIREELQVG